MHITVITCGFRTTFFACDYPLPYMKWDHRECVAIPSRSDAAAARRLAGETTAAAIAPSKRLVMRERLRGRD